MTPRLAALFTLALYGHLVSGQTTPHLVPSPQAESVPAKRLVILKVDGLNADLLYRAIAEKDPRTGRSRLPWMDQIFARNGTIFENFYTRGISLSAPSWSMLDSGQHAIIRGNVEFDRYTGRVYDYLNFFPLYLSYARYQRVDMPGVEVLDAAGIPLLADRFPVNEQVRGFELFQRGVNWSTIKTGMEKGLANKDNIYSMIENAGTPELSARLDQESLEELLESLREGKTVYLDAFTGDIDHVAHATNSPEILALELRKIDQTAGQIWNAIQASPLSAETVFVVVSDHGMNNVPLVKSQGYSLPDLFNSTAGGAHHVITDRHQFDQFKLAGLDPLVSRVYNASDASLYLKGQASKYPTAWLDLDGNERATVQLRNSDLNRIHILLLALKRSDLAPEVRRAAAADLARTIDRHRAAWTETRTTLAAELQELQTAIEARKLLVSKVPRDIKKWSEQEHAVGSDKVLRRKWTELNDWEEERRRYQAYLDCLDKLMALHPDPEHPLEIAIPALIPELSLGDFNTAYNLQNYVVGPGPEGLAITAGGDLDEERSFRRVNYFPMLVAQRVRNVPQRGVLPQPVDFTAMRLPASAIPLSWQASTGETPITFGIWLYRSDERQLLELVRETAGGQQIRLVPIARLRGNRDGTSEAAEIEWQEGLPLDLFEDQAFELPGDDSREAWLSEWHSEADWFRAIHRTAYSNAVVGLTEELLPMEYALPARPSLNAHLEQLELRRRHLVEGDFHIFARDHWNFNARSFNPGGNHGSFFRISTHSVWMMSGAGVPKGARVEEPYDSLSFGSTLLNLMGKPPVFENRIVQLPVDHAMAP